MNTSRTNIFMNAFLSVSKLAIGFIAHSAAMINDGINNASDVVGSVIVIIGVSAAAKESDEHHQYGHERLECVASILVSGIVMALGVGLFVEGVGKIFTGSYKHLPIPGVLAAIAAIGSIIIKEIMFLYTRSAAKKTGSSALMASASDSQSDVLATSAGLIGIIGSRLGIPVADSIAAIVISLFIFKVGLDIFNDGMYKMVDHACPDEVVQEIRKVVEDQQGVLRVDLLQTRMFGSRAYVDVEILAEGNQSLIQAHAIAERVHHAIEINFPQVKHCMVHVNPAKDKFTGTQRV
ncbi:cation diffusion facilitator family transporter [Sphaerochaeta sp. PS]|uniref:cation diffusion facilitator family transporter n=1 Tax=Sphaerochaeta sp. PS TaxID=3076336 RepID=UPI0028A3A9FC|nr:cation diffusion facilitator family transporter [Sphaerochaeta sp. PS]MDT4762607.1 cation diffusion facilitator family transporter [Sphaerochaeta sp. PS]